MKTTKEAIAAQLDQSEYPLRLPKTIVMDAKESRLVIIYGYSDDLMEFEGAISDEREAYEGTTVLIDSEGIIDHFETLLDKRDKERLRKYFQRDGKGKTIEALWCDEEGYHFTYKTEIPHATFEVMEEGDHYCRGIVFSLDDLAAPPETETECKTK